MVIRLFKKYDASLTFVAVAIVFYGILTIYSAKKGGAEGSSFAQRQFVWAIIGFIAMIAAGAIDLRWLSSFNRHIYAVNMILLVTVLVLGHSAKGAQRWIGFGTVKIQPSEFAKLVLIITLSVYYTTRELEASDFRTLFGSFLHAAPVILLVFIQPDLGTTLVLLTIWFGISYIAGARVKHLALFAVAGVILFSIAWHANIIKDYQKNRLTSFLNAKADPLGSGYHIIQSRIAIGSGKIEGKGYLQGTQNQLRFIPEQHTDFIFTVVGEEFGFVGAGILLSLYAFLIYRILALLNAAEDNLGRLVSGGIFFLIMFQMTVNIGMTIGLLPVTGIPLPLFSYGGSNLLTTLTLIGILQAVHASRHRIDF